MMKENFQNELCSKSKMISLVVVLISLSVAASATEPRKCYWCGPLAEQVHKSTRAPPCNEPSVHVTACDDGFTHCAVVATSPPYTESRLCVKLYQDECYSLYCNSTKTWRMTCPCRGDLCNGPNTQREKEAFSILTKLVAKLQNTRNKRELISAPKFITKNNNIDNNTHIKEINITTNNYNETANVNNELSNETSTENKIDIIKIEVTEKIQNNEKIEHDNQETTSQDHKESQVINNTVSTTQVTTASEHEESTTIRLLTTIKEIPTVETLIANTSINEKETENVVTVPTVISTINEPSLKSTEILPSVQSTESKSLTKDAEIEPSFKSSTLEVPFINALTTPSIKNIETESQVMTNESSTKESEIEPSLKSSTLEVPFINAVTKPSIKNIEIESQVKTNVSSTKEAEIEPSFKNTIDVPLKNEINPSTKSVEMESQLKTNASESSTKGAENESSLKNSTIEATFKNEVTNPSSKTTQTESHPMTTVSETTKGTEVEPSTKITTMEPPIKNTVTKASVKTSAIEESTKKVDKMTTVEPTTFKNNTATQINHHVLTLVSSILLHHYI